MRNFVRKLVAAVGLALSLLAVASTVYVPVAVAQPVPLGQRSFAPRIFQTQQRHYIRFSVNFNSCVYVSLVCSVKVGTVPYNAFITGGFSQITTSWNAGTSAAIGLGTVTPAVNIVASATGLGGAAGNAAALTIVATGLGLGVTGNGIAQTGTLGGFDIFATITIVGALPTAGATQFVLEYIAPNDGSCTQVPLGATAPAC